MLHLKIPPPVIFVLSAASMFALSDFEVKLAMWRLISSTALWAVASVIALASIWSFLQAKTTVNPHHPHKSSTLIVAGIFCYSRNPMYLSLVALLLGWSCLLSGYWNLLPIVGFIAYIHYFQIKPEEEVLANKFGKEYRDYIKKVRRWL
ncbi:isoprenylcysteine carboxylmethyltransferase family protein [Marinomonas sp. A79]|uniref:Isoprenylcysteine carboxylmethyltransferase family protein n=1 Tax=Marinomonas vulgaris TaxID=2823372 RepID=A0ABS5H6Y5_9GAMM|nr:isoprenylcysteine carboxylmethyltransferase family protein [Marinomonas vulgaris]MBR7887472.1 isoprenylcysteine carboxylmethyltransferase family protein [Marinomonas vulgaris]